MKITTKLSFKDFLGLQFLLVYKKPAFIFITLCGLVMLTFSVLYFFGYWEKGSFPVFQLIFSFFTLVVLPYSIYNAAKKQFGINTNLKEALEYNFNPLEIIIKGETFISHLPWQKTYMVEEFNNWLLIYQDDRVVNVIPKRSFTDEQLVKFKEMIKNIAGLKMKFKN